MDDLKSWIRNNGRPEIGSLDEQILIAIMKPSNVSDEILSNTPNTRLLDSYVACIKGYDSQKVPPLELLFNLILEFIETDNEDFHLTKFI